MVQNTFADRRRIPVQDESENESDDDASPLPDAYHSRAGGSGGARAGGGRVATRLYDEEEEDEDWDEVDEVRHWQWGVPLQLSLCVDCWSVVL